MTRLPIKRYFATRESLVLCATTRGRAPQGKTHCKKLGEPEFFLLEPIFALQKASMVPCSTVPQSSEIAKRTSPLLLKLSQPNQ